MTLYKSNKGDVILKTNYLGQQSIIKSYQLITMKQDHFKNKIGIVESEITNDINKKIDTNIYQYLSMKNVNSIMREYLIEQQN